MPNPIIFLDIDGVLNSTLHWHRRIDDAHGNVIRVSKEGNQIDPEGVKLLNDIIEKTSAQVVISSTWRLMWGEDGMQSQLEDVGFKGEVIGVTKDLRRGENSSAILRGNEILCWMQDHPDLTGASYFEYKRYVIFDDDSDMLLWQKDNFIHVDPHCGLTPRNATQAIKILNANRT